MKFSEFKALKEGDVLITNGMCGVNRGRKVRVKYIPYRDPEDAGIVPIELVEGETPFSDKDPFNNCVWGEVHYKALNLV